METIEHKMINVNGLKMHIAQKGEGPLVLFLHGFPELWYSWRHQILFLASRGYRAVAPDLRGYGDTTGAPTNDATKFSVMHVVGDLVALLDEVAPGEEKVFVVGHDWGAIIAWYFCLFRPDRVKALVNLSVALLRRNPVRNLVESIRLAYGNDHYICRFQVPGEIEDEFASIGTKTVMKKFLTYREPAPFFFPKGKGFGGPPVVMPPWLSEQDIDYYSSKYEKTGFTGGINYYRALPTTWELTAAWAGAKVLVPTKFIVGDLDLVYHNPGNKDYINKGGLKGDVPLLEEVVVMEGASHWINQEKADEINDHIYNFIQKY